MSSALIQFAAAQTGERRSSRRYPIRTDITYKLLCNGRLVGRGVGRTVDLSSRGLLFESPLPLPYHSRIEISIAWPALLNDSVPLNLWVQGKSVGSRGLFTAVRIDRYVFRTGRSRPAVGARLNAAASGA